MRRELWETIVELADALAPVGAELEGVRVTGMELDVPMEFVLASSRRGVSLVAELPRWRLASGFDAPRSRLRVAFEEALLDA